MYTIAIQIKTNGFMAKPIQAKNQIKALRRQIDELGARIGFLQDVLSQLTGNGQPGLPRPVDSESGLRNLLNSVPCPALVVQEGKYVYANPMGLGLLGYESLQGLVGMSATDTLAPGCRASFMACLSGMPYNAGKQPLRVQVQTQSGGRRWVDTFMLPLVYSGKPSELVIANDVTERAFAGSNLHDAESKYRAVIETSFDGFWILDMQGRIMEVNDTYVKQSGYTRQELLSMHVSQLEAFEDDERIRLHIEKVKSSGSDLFETQHRRKDGTIWHVEVNVSFWDIDDGRLFSFMRDITRRKKVEVELRRAEFKFRTVADNTYDWEFWLTPLGEFIYNSPSCKRITGYDAEDFVLNPGLFSQIVHPEDYNTWTKHHRHQQKGGDLAELEFRIIHADGSTRWVHHVCQPIVDETGSFLGIRGSIKDETARKHSDLQLRASEERYRNLVETAQEGIWTMDGESRTTFVNKRMEQMLGYDAHEMLGREVTLFMPADELPGHHEQIAHRRMGSAGLYERRFKRKDGSIFSALVSASPIFEGNRYAGSIALLIDISERKEAEEAIRRSEEKYRLLTEQLPVGVYRTSLDGRILFANDTLARILGFRKTADLLEHNIIGFFANPADRNYQMEFWAEHPDRTLYQEFEFRTIKGKKIYVRDTGRVVLDDSKRMLHFEGVIEDITQQTIAHRALHESELKYRSLVSNAEDLICEIDDAGYYTFVSDRYMEVLGYKPRELLGTNAFDIVHHDDRPQALAQFTDFLMRRKGSMALLRYRHKNGHYVNLECRGSLYLDKDSRSKVVVISRDLTHKIETERIIAENEARYSLLFNNMSTGVAIYKPIDSGADFEFVDINRAGERNSKVIRANVIGRRVTEVFPAVAEIGLLDVLREVSETGLPQTLPLREYSDGRITEWVENYVFKLPNGHVLAFYDDTSEKQKAEQLLRESEEQLNVIFNNAPAIMMLLNQETEVLRMNRFGLESIGRLEPEVVGLRGGDVLCCINAQESGCGFSDSCSNCKLRKTVERTFRTGHGFFKVEAEVVRLDGDWKKRHTVLVSTAIVSFQPQMKVLVTIDDITKRKELEYELIKAKEKAEENDKLKSAFLANISHEIRTPMNGIIGFSEMIAKPNISDEKRKHYSKVIIEGCQQLLGIINDVLDISKIETGQVTLKRERVCVNEILLETLTFFKPSANRNNLTLYLKKSLPDRLSTITADGTKLRQILTNLVGNALKFTREGYIEFGYSLNVNILDFYVKDTGIGIDPSLQQAIFERFRQAETSNSRRYGGTGLGLAISKALVNLMGGDIWVESELGKGSVFHFTLPYAPVDAESQKDVRVLGDGANPILIAEDEEVNYLFLEEILLEHGYAILHAKNGLEATELCASHPEIGLVLMDIKMPVLDGAEAARRILAMRPDLPIVAQTAYALNSEIESLRSIGFVDYLVKPIDRNKLLEVISRVC